MPPKPNPPPEPTIAVCPKCKRPKGPNQVKCLFCGTRTCKNGHIISSKVCPECGWKDPTFKPPIVAGKSGTIAPDFDETTTHKVQYMCPQCHNPAEENDKRCTICGSLGPWQPSGEVRDKKSFKIVSDVASAAPRQYSDRAVEQRTPLKESASSQLRDMAPKKWIQQQKGPLIEHVPVHEKQVRRPRGWENQGERSLESLSEWAKDKVWVAVRIAALIIFVAIIALVILMNNEGIQSALSAMPKSMPTTHKVADVIPPEISQVSGSEVTEGSAIITWVTDEPATSQVEYGETTDYGNITVLDKQLVTTHSVKLNALNHSMTYHYRVKAEDASANPASDADRTFMTAAPPDTTPPVIIEVKVIDVLDTGATITWVTDEKATSQVEYGITTDYGSTTSTDNSLIISHSVIISGLETDKTYFFRVKSSDASKNEAVFDKNQSFNTLQPVPTGLEVGKRAPDFTVYALDGAPVTLSKLRGKIVMVNFWAVGCGACVAEMPDIEAVYKTWSGPKKLEVLAINAGDYEVYIKNKIEEEKWTLPIFIDSDKTAVREYQISRIPRTFFVDTNGIIRKIEMGRFDNQDQIKEALNYLQ